MIRVSIRPETLRSTIKVLAFLAFALVLAGCGRPNVSGVYIAKSHATVAMLEIVQTDDGKISGKLTGIMVAGDGEIQDTNATVSGVIHEGAIHLEVRPMVLFPIATGALAGTIEGKSMKLNGDASDGKVQTAEFVRAEVSDFQTWADDLRKLSQTTLAARARAEEKAAHDRQLAEAAAQWEKDKKKLVDDIDDLIARVDRLHEKIEEYLPKFEKAEKLYKGATKGAQDLLDRQRKMPSSFARGQALFSMELALGFSGSMEATHNSAESLKRDFDKATANLELTLAILADQCGTFGGKSAPVPIGTACERLTAAASNSPSLEKMRAAFKKADATYAEEKKKQDAILAQAKQVAGQ